MNVKYTNILNGLTFLIALSYPEIRELDCAIDAAYTDGYLKGYNEAIKKGAKHEQ